MYIMCYTWNVNQEVQEPGNKNIYISVKNVCNFENILNENLKLTVTALRKPLAVNLFSFSDILRYAFLTNGNLNAKRNS